MSVPVSLDELPEMIERFGATAYVVTVGADGRPRATSVTVRCERSLLLLAAGRRTAENVDANESVALLWPAPQPGEHALIVDGRGAVQHGPEHDVQVFVQPGKAVLHVTARAHDDVAVHDRAGRQPADDAAPGALTADDSPAT